MSPFFYYKDLDDEKVYKFNVSFICVADGCVCQKGQSDDL